MNEYFLLLFFFFFRWHCIKLQASYGVMWKHGITRTCWNLIFYFCISFSTSLLFWAQELPSCLKVIEPVLTASSAVLCQNLGSPIPSYSFICSFTNAPDTLNKELQFSIAGILLKCPYYIRFLFVFHIAKCNYSLNCFWRKIHYTYARVFTRSVLKEEYILAVFQSFEWEIYFWFKTWHLWHFC